MSRDRYNIVLVTGTDFHHKYWVCSLCERYNVVAIIHPHPPSTRLLNTIKRGSKYGYAWLPFKVASKLFNRLSKDSRGHRHNACEVKFFGDAGKRYEKLPKDLIHHVGSINDPDVIQLMRDVSADVVCFLGGDLAKQEFLDTARIAGLNFHSGLSPFYNGAATLYWAVSDFRPNFAGGTLMYITERVDGGPVLYHYLPPISADDDASSLFMKNIIGAVKLYDMALEAIQQGTPPTGVLQQRSMKYLRTIDWTIMQDLRLRYFNKNRMMRRFVRDEEVISYAEVSGDDAFTFEETLKVVLRKGEGDR